MIQNASTSVDLVMYELDDAKVEDALVAAQHRGIAVRVLLNEGYYGQPAAVNGRAYEYLGSRGISVKWTPAQFALTHEKALVVDGASVMIMTFNFTPQFYATSRDFGIVDDDRSDASAIESAFDADWQPAPRSSSRSEVVGNETATLNADDLVWSPGSESATIALIDSATSTLDIYNEEMADKNIMNALESAARRGVAVRVDMTYANEWKPAFEELSAAGVEIRTYAPKAALYIHAKIILADTRVAFVGSQNFSSTSQDNNRELGILLTEPKIIESLSTTFDGDWKNAAPF
jgi:phosphatidylserine/phosphatidylglycerophosphate/cardiolipin synthase-like enzyme